MASDVGKRIASRLNKVAREIHGASKPAVTKAAGLMKDAIEREIKPASGGDMRLSGVGRKGAKVGANYVVTGEPGGDASAKVRATGPLHFIENDTKAGPRHRRRGRRGRVNAFGADPPKPSMHPGTKGKHPFKKGVDKSRDRAVKALIDAQHDALKRGFR